MSENNKPMTVISRETYAPIEHRADRFADCMDTVRAAIAPGSTLVLHSFNYSDDGEWRSVAIIRMSNGEAWNVSHVFAAVTGELYSQNDGAIRVQGGGMDTGLGFIQNVVRQLTGTETGPIADHARIVSL